jgi:hypothetical protein
MGIGEDNLGDLARSEIEAARRDPRIDRSRGAMVADFWSAIEEAERVRIFGIVGLHELQHALERKEQELEVSREDEDLEPRVASQLQTAWERAEMARAEIDAGHPHSNAQALLSMNSALDALVEELAPSLRGMRINWIVDRALDHAKREVPEVVEQVAPEVQEAFASAARDALDTHIPKSRSPRGAGVSRYEKVLAQEGLDAPEDRPVPVGLDEALAELNAIRDVLVHRAGRIDYRAMQAAPSLRYKDGELVRITRDEYRTYSAAIRCYATEILYRPLRHWPEADDAKHGPDLADWRGYCRIGV